jgi:hypothetical protein
LTRNREQAETLRQAIRAYSENETQDTKPANEGGPVFQ